MSTTYQVRRTRCSGAAPPAARIAEILLKVWRTWLPKSAGKWPWVSQPITPPVTTSRPSAAMPLAYPFGAGQPLGCSTCGPVGVASVLGTGTTDSAGPFGEVTGYSPSLVQSRHSLRGGLRRCGAGRGDLPQRKPLQLAGSSLRQLYDI